MTNPVLSLSEVTEVTISDGTSLSDAINLGGRVPVAVQIPASWTAAGLSFEASMDGTTYAPLLGDDGTEYTATVDSSQHVALSPAKFYGARFLKLRSGTSAAAVNQVGDITLQLALGRPDI